MPQLCWFLDAGAEIAVVEHQGAQPGCCKDVRKAIKMHFLHGGEAVSHDDGRENL